LFDFNHSLTGKTPCFQVKVAALQLARAEAPSHGHVRSAEHEY